MELIGRLTGNASIATMPNGTQLVKFRIACNHQYKTKQAEIRRLVTFFDCAYWRNTGIAPLLSKGTLVELSGRVDAHAYLDKERQPKARLNFYVSNITLHGRPQPPAASQNPDQQEAANENIPF